MSAALSSVILTRTQNRGNFPKTSSFRIRFPDNCYRVQFKQVPPVHKVAHEHIKVRLRRDKAFPRLDVTDLTIVNLFQFDVPKLRRVKHTHLESRLHDILIVQCMYFDMGITIFDREIQYYRLTSCDDTWNFKASRQGTL